MVEQSMGEPHIPELNLTNDESRDNPLYWVYIPPEPNYYHPSQIYTWALHTSPHQQTRRHKLTELWYMTKVVSFW